MAAVLAWEIQALAAEFGIEKLGFLTLTFAENIVDMREAQRRFHSLNTHVLKGRYSRAIGVWERSKNRRVHFHLVIVLADDIRTGFDFEAIERRDYRSAGKSLKREWAFWRKVAPNYGFGRTELLPVKSNSEGIARYVGKYVSKHIRQREPGDLGRRVVRFIGYRPGDRTFTARFAWNTPGAWAWRQKLQRFAKGIHVDDFSELQRLFGSRWAYFLAPSILAQDISDLPFPDEQTARTESEARLDRQAVLARACNEHRKANPLPPVHKTYALKDCACR